MRGEKLSPLITPHFFCFPQKKMFLLTYKHCKKIKNMLKKTHLLGSLGFIENPLKSYQTKNKLILNSIFSTFQFIAFLDFIK
jgi:hypothetical protein